MQDHPLIMKIKIKVLEWKLTSVNKCVEVEHLRGSINQGTLMYFQRLSMVREPATDDCKSQGTQNDFRLLSHNKWSEFNGMKSTGRRELRHPSSPNMRYSAKLYNVEGLDHNVHKPVTVLGVRTKFIFVRIGLIAFKILSFHGWLSWFPNFSH